MANRDGSDAGLTRRAFTLGCSASLLVRPVSAMVDKPVVMTANGAVVGDWIAGVRRFLGIPYGASTSGNGRFAPPKPPASWNGLRDATRFGQSSPQITLPITPVDLPYFEGLGDPKTVVQGEDCLVLNIWAPAHTHAPCAVMVWLHGGGFVLGSASTALYDGANLAARGDVVLVSINHRLGSAGYTDFSRILGGDFAQSANIGMQDIVAALTWVRDNIGFFGGDANSVTIFGESGGGQKVSTLLAMPSAKGLFHRAVIQSGPLTKGLTALEADRVANSLLSELSLSPKTASRLREMPFDQIVAAEGRVFAKAPRRPPGFASGFAPVIDGEIITQNMFDPQAAAPGLSVPLLIGQNGTEFTLFSLADKSAYALDATGLGTRVSAIFGAEVGTKLIAIYEGLYPRDSATDRWFRLYSDYMMASLNVTIADSRTAERAAPVYAYRFDWFTPVSDGILRSPHSLEIPFVFDNALTSGLSMTGGGAEVSALAKTVSTAWVNFAKTGKPSAAELPAWPVYSKRERLAMHLNISSAVLPYVNRDVIPIMQKVLYASVPA